jgi:selenocysteine lyase/cysteine desulfurase
MSMIRPQDFPAASRCTYLNSASVALMFQGASEATLAWERDIADFGTLNFDERAEDAVFDELRAQFAGLIGAASSDVAVASSATELIASLAWAVMPPAGSNIVACDVVFPSTVYPWARTARHTGCELRWVKARDGMVSEDDLLAAIDDRTAVVCISQVEYGTGQRYDLARLAEAAHAHGALLAVDATQAAGAIPIDVAKEPVDALISASYKWMCGPFGVGLMYLAPRWQAALEPGLVGWRSHKDVYDLQADRLEYRPDARRFEFSTMAYGCAIGLAKSIGYLREIGVARVYEHNLRLADELLESLRRVDAQIVSPTSSKSRTSIVGFRLPGWRPENVVARLGEQGIVVSRRRDLVRVSPHLYNTSQDIERLAEALAGIVHRR